MMPPIPCLQPINCLLALQDGSVLANGFGLSHILSDGTPDRRFNCHPDGRVWALAQMSNGDVFIGGDFNSIDRVRRKHLARILLTEQTPEPLLLGPFFVNGKPRLYLPTVPSRTYHLESATSLDAALWTAAGSITGDGQWRTIEDRTAIEGNRFFRVRVEK